jgi:GABA(A) receptor-associated protein
MEFKFKKQNPDIQVRKAEAIKILEKYPNRVPIICEKDPKSNMKDIDKTKYLVPIDLTVSQFSFIVRKRLMLEKSSALFLLVNGKHAVSGGILMLLT